MDDQVTGECKVKRTPAVARHLRRKNLKARIAAENTSQLANIQLSSSNNINNQSTEDNNVLKQSIRQKSKEKNKQENFISEKTSEIYQSNVFSCPLIEKPRADADKNRRESIENEKNLKINDHASFNNSENTELIMNSRTAVDQVDAAALARPIIPNLPDHTSSKVAKTPETPVPSVVEASQDVKMSAEGKTREEIKAEREAKKAAKIAAKAKAKTAPVKNVPSPDVKSPTDQVTKDVPSTPNVLPPTKAEPLTSELSKLSLAEPSKSKADLRAERRAKQEAQRAAKSEIKEKVKPTAPAPVKKASEPLPKSTEPAKKVVLPLKIVPVKNSHEINLFKHLYQERELASGQFATANSSIHPVILRLGTQYAHKIIVGCNARCIAFLVAVKQLIEDYERPPQADFTRGLETRLQESATYLNYCRPLAVSMQNALRHLKWQMTQLPPTISDEEAKNKLKCAIDTYIQEQILLADKAISITIQTKILNGDVILTYGYSSLIQKILCDAFDAGRQFRVVVVDGRPWLEGKELLRRLAKHGLECSYVLVNALSFIMPEVSKVFLGAHAILANGAVMSRAGTAQVALMAKLFNVPVLVACETHKSSERVQTDSIVYNEIGNPDELTKSAIDDTDKSVLANWRARKSLNLLNIMYDVTPADLVTAVVTELAILPCTSVPVILRIKPSEI